MRKLIKKTLIFMLFLILLFCILIILPPTPRVSSSLLFAAVKKDSLLINTPLPRIIFVGGSNLSFGLNSYEIKYSLQINPINTAINARIGIKYMLENTLQYVQKGDIIILIPEYNHFYRDWNSGSEELFRTFFDVDKSKIRLLNYEQMRNCFPYSGGLAISKLNIIEYIRRNDSDVYSVNSFNKYGDVDAHWNLKNRHSEFRPDKAIDIVKYKPEVINELKKIANILQNKGCVFLVSFPCYQESSYNNNIEAIKKIEKEYHANGFYVLGSPERYMMPDSLMFNTVYHINRKGVELRTKYLIKDLKMQFFHN